MSRARRTTTDYPIRIGLDLLRKNRKIAAIRTDDAPSPKNDVAGMTPDNLERLKKRGLGHKRSMGMREFALGMDSLQRFVEHAPLTRVHQGAFGVLAIESEPVDPRL